MNLKMRCQHCSKPNEAESLDDSAFSRIEAAKAKGWYASLSETYRIVMYFCSTDCERQYKLKTKTHLTIVGMVSR